MDLELSARLIGGIRLFLHSRQQLRSAQPLFDLVLSMA